jgi:hypothetical protein
VNEKNKKKACFNSRCLLFLVAFLLFVSKKNTSIIIITFHCVCFFFSMSDSAAFHEIPSEAWNEYDPETGELVGEYCMNDEERSPDELKAVMRRHTKESELKRGDLVLFDGDGGYRQMNTYVWDGSELHSFQNELSSRWDYTWFPFEARISIDEFASVTRYVNAYLYNPIVWLDTTGYTQHKDDQGALILTHLTKQRRYRVPEGTLFQDWAPWVPFFFLPGYSWEDGGGPTTLMQVE